MTRPMIEIVPLSMAIADWRAVYREGAEITLSAAAREAISASAKLVAGIVRSGKAAYGINTGFGKLANTRIAPADLAALQRNLVLSHTVGVGDPLPAPVVRLVLALKIASIAVGASGVRLAVVDMMAEMLRRDVLPRIPGQGSVGASGDLAPLAHLTAAMLGFGSATVRGVTMPAAEALAAAELVPLELGAKEGLALLNGTQVSTALALSGLFETENVLQTALIVGAMTTDAALGSETPFRPEIQSLRPHPGQAEVAAHLRSLLVNSPLRAIQREKGRLQDPYCLRCQPQVLGACLDLMRFAARTLEIEASAASDNPLILMETKEVVSGGNFHAEPVAFAADILALAIAEIGSISERRIAMLTDASMSGLPPFLTSDPGLNSGFMSSQIVAAALVSENRQRAHPASVDNVPTVANQEDHVSMATHGARRLVDMTRNAASISAIELLAATEGLEFRLPTRTSPRLEAVRTLVRSKVETMSLDRHFEPAVALALQMVHSGAVIAAAGAPHIQIA